MAEVSKSKATLRVIGDSLVPDDITRMLGTRPTKSQIKGQSLPTKTPDRSRIAKRGSWHLSAAPSEPSNIDQQVKDLLEMLTDDLSVWDTLRNDYRVDMFCGLFMKEFNEGMTLSPGTLKLLADRGIDLDLDIYGPDNSLQDD